jgi:hypothetical protein
MQNEQEPPTFENLVPIYEITWRQISEISKPKLHFTNVPMRMW